MTNTVGIVKSICPFFISDDSLGIRCEGFTQDAVIKLCFDLSARKKSWQEEKCFRYEYANNCPLARALVRNIEKRMEGEDA